MMQVRLLLLSCLAAFLGGGCQTTTCGATDFDCAMEHLSIRIDGDAQRWTRVDKNRLPAQPTSTMSAGADGYVLQMIPLSVPNWGDPVELLQSGLVGVTGGGAGAPAAPTLSSPSVKLALSSPSDVQTVMLSFVDPNGEFPSLCARLCDPMGRCGPYWWCNPPRRDLLDVGIVPIQMQLNAFVEHGIDFGTASKIEPSPIVPTPIVPSPLQPLPPFAPVAGAPLRWPLDPPEPPAAGGGGGNDPNMIGNFGQCASRPFSCDDPKTVPMCDELKFCATGTFGAADTCQGAWFGLLNGQATEFDCTCSDMCINAAMAALSHCCPPAK